MLEWTTHSRIQYVLFDFHTIILMSKLSVVKVVFLELYPAIRYNLLFAANKRISLYQASSPVVSGLYKFIKVYNTSL
jgi:hypothetical protein